MPPKFSLQSVLDYRHNRVEVLEIQLGQFIAAQKEVGERLEFLDNAQAGLFKELQVRQKGTVDLVAVGHLRINLKAIGSEIKMQQSLWTDLEQQIQMARAEIILARQDEEILATLKEKALKRYQAEQAQQELRLQDDIYIAQSYRRSGAA
jgi:flagellar export protein FliJ